MPTSRRRWKKKRGPAPRKRITAPSMYGFGQGKMGQGTPYYINREIPVPVAEPVPIKDWFDRTEERLKQIERFSGQTTSTVSRVGEAASSIGKGVTNVAIGGLAAYTALNPSGAVQFAANTAAKYTKAAGEGMAQSQPAQAFKTAAQAAGKTARATGKTVKTIFDDPRGAAQNITVAGLQTAKSAGVAAVEVVKGVIAGTKQYGQQETEEYYDAQSIELEQTMEAYEAGKPLSEPTPQPNFQIKELELKARTAHFNHQVHLDWVDESASSLRELTKDPTITLAASNYIIPKDGTTFPDFKARSTVAQAIYTRDKKSGEWISEEAPKHFIRRRGAPIIRGEYYLPEPPTAPWYNPIGLN